MKHSLNAEKRKKGPLLWAVFITILMLGSTIGYVFSGFQDNTQEKADHIYKTYSFTKTESGWVFFKDNKQVYVDYLPEEVESIDFTTIPFDKGKVYAAFKSTEKDSSLDYSLGKVYTFLKERDYNPFFACILEEGCPDIPIVDCQESSFPIVLFKNGDATKIYIDGQCTVLEGDSLGLSRASDRFIYGTLGVI